MTRKFYGWTLLTVVWFIMAFNLGFPAYSPSVINPEMGKSLSFTRDVIGLMMSIYIILSGLPGPLVAMVINRLGSRTTIIIGSLMIVAGASAMATVVDTALGAYLAFGLLVGGGVCTGGALPLQTAVARWFLRRRAMALSIMYSAGAIGGAFAAKLLELLILRTGDWRDAWWVIAGFSALAAVLALVFVREKPEDMGQAVDGVSEADIAATRGVPAKPKPAFITDSPWEFRDAVRSPTYWLILGSLLGGSGMYTLFLAHGKLLLEDFGHAAGIGGTAVFTMTISGLVAKVIIVLFGDRIDPKILWGVFMAFFGFGTGGVRARNDGAAGLRVCVLPGDRLWRRSGLPHDRARQLFRPQGLRTALWHRHCRQHHAERDLLRGPPAGYSNVAMDTRASATSWLPGVSWARWCCS